MPFCSSHFQQYTCHYFSQNKLIKHIHTNGNQQNGKNRNILVFKELRAYLCCDCLHCFHSNNVLFDCSPIMWKVFSCSECIAQLHVNSKEFIELSSNIHTVEINTSRAIMIEFYIHSSFLLLVYATEIKPLH